MIESFQSSKRSRLRYHLAIATIALASGFYAYTVALDNGRARVLAESKHDGNLVVGLSLGFVRAYSELEANHVDSHMPNPAEFRAHALELAQLSDFLAESIHSEVVGLPGRAINKSPTEPALIRHLARFQKSRNPEVATYEFTRGDNTLHGTIWPFYATEQACVACHNTAQNLSGPNAWKLGDLMGAQVVEKDITAQLFAANYQATGIGVLVFFGIGALLYCGLFLRRQLSMTTELKTLATVDALTGCLNRREMYSRTAGLQDSVSGAILMLDIDHFKNINDTFGHAAGDCIIKDASKNVKAVLRKSDWVARVGGEEFLVWLSGVSPEDAMIIAERIRSQCASARTTIGTRNIAYTVSIGIHTVLNAPASDFDEWVNAADKKLYQAKGAGRNCVMGLQLA